MDLKGIIILVGVILYIASIGKSKTHILFKLRFISVPITFIGIMGIFYLGLIQVFPIILADCAPYISAGSGDIEETCALDKIAFLISMLVSAGLIYLVEKNFGGVFHKDKD